MAAAIHMDYCCIPPTILRWLELICACIIIALTEPGIDAWRAYPFFIFVGAFCLICTFLLLLIYFGDFHRTALRCWSWGTMESLFNFIAAILNFIVFAIAVYDCVKMFKGEWDHHDNNFIRGVSSKEWRERMAGVAAVSGFAGILYCSSGTYATRGSYVIVV